MIAIFKTAKLLDNSLVAAAALRACLIEAIRSLDMLPEFTIYNILKQYLSRFVLCNYTYQLENSKMNLTIALSSFIIDLPGITSTF